MSMLQGIIGFLVLPVIATVAGGVIAVMRPPGPRVQTYLQHITAGIVFAAVTCELIPEIKEGHSSLPLVLGFALGVIMMLGIRWLTSRLITENQHEATGTVRVPRWLFLTVGIDLWLAGLLVGLGFAVGAQQGTLLAIGLALEVGSLSLSTATALRKWAAPRGWVVVIISALALLVAAGVRFGFIFANNLSGASLVTALSFGAAALLYLVMDKLLRKAREAPETPFLAAPFFAGFLALFVIALIIEMAA